MVKSIDGEVLTNVDNFIYLGSEIESTDKEIKIRIAKSWAALDKLSSIWKSPLCTTLKRNFFRAVVESVLLYGSEAWTLTKKHEKKLDGTYTRMLRAIKAIKYIMERASNKDSPLRKYSTTNKYNTYTKNTFRRPLLSK